MGRRSHSRRFSKDNDVERGLLATTMDIDLEDQPPPSLIVRKNRYELTQSVDNWRQSIDPNYGTEDVLMPLPLPVSGHAEHRRGHGHGRHGEQPPITSGPSRPATGAADPRQHDPLGSPSSEGRLERMFKGAVNDPPVEYSHAPTDTARSEISSAEGYRLAKPTPPVRFVPSQPMIIPADQLGTAAQSHSALYHLADRNNHVPMAADIVSVCGLAPDQEDDMIAIPPVGAHTRESANYRPQSPDLDAFPSPSTSPTTAIHHQPQPRAGPSMSSPPRSPAGLRRTSAQYYPSKPPPRKKHSVPPDITTVNHSVPTSLGGRSRPLYQVPSSGSLQSHQVDGLSSIRGSRNFSPHLPPLSTLPPKSPNPPSMRQFPISPIDDGLSRYPPHLSSPYPMTPRQSRP